ncbi:4,5-DOPA dioxygenase extradiol [Rubrolithibacter danxiaensis]|uniref:4,5-DOPA-extradiol-dioxygenase n=1 Tax=Rubrolithibacter danxiaensis TaxID=3390805 RepID=UPI003BF91480
MNNLQDLHTFSSALKNTDRMPLLFVGHGNPMNAIADNTFNQSWKKLGQELPRPKAILVISAHWITPKSTCVTATNAPKTIHDFGGFPQELFEQQYKAPGAPEMAKEVQSLVASPEVLTDHEWGLDHGSWSILLPMFPLADIPVFQVSIDYTQPPTFHYKLGQELKKLRDKGVLIIGSGNIVHNLQAVDWQGRKTYDWALEFDQKIAAWIEENKHQHIIDFQKLDTLASLAHPTYDHFLPLLYILGMQDKKDQISFFNSEFDMSSISMRSVIYS